MCLEPRVSLLIGRFWMPVTAVFNKESSWLACFCWGTRDRPRRRCCLIPSMAAKRKRVCWGEQPNPSGVKRGNGDRQRHSPLLWKRTTALLGNMLRALGQRYIWYYGLVCGVVEKSIVSRWKEAQERGKQRWGQKGWWTERWDHAVGYLAAQINYCIKDIKKLLM